MHVLSALYLCYWITSALVSRGRRPEVQSGKARACSHLLSSLPPLQSRQDLQSVVDRISYARELAACCWWACASICSPSKVGARAASIHSLANARGRKTKNVVPCPMNPQNKTQSDQSVPNLRPACAYSSPFSHDGRAESNTWRVERARERREVKPR